MAGPQRVNKTTTKNTTTQRFTWLHCSFMPVLEMNTVAFSLATDLGIESCPLSIEDTGRRGYHVRHGTVWATSIEKQSVTLDEGFS